jgi:hypothetical protein
MDTLSAWRMDDWMAVVMAAMKVHTMAGLMAAN